MYMEFEALDESNKGTVVKPVKRIEKFVTEEKKKSNKNGSVKKGAKKLKERGRSGICAHAFKV